MVKYIIKQSKARILERLIGERVYKILSIKNGRSIEYKYEDISLPLITRDQESFLRLINGGTENLFVENYKSNAGVVARRI